MLAQSLTSFSPRRCALSAVVFAVALLCAFPAIAGRNAELVLSPALTRELNLVLKTSEALHKSLVRQDDEQVEIGLKDLLQQIDHARALSHLAKPHERAHLVRILDAAREQFEVTKTAYGEQRRAHLEDAFNQLVNLVRIYRLDRAYGIFFCPKDKTTWVQKGAKPQNPFRTEGGREPCGMRVER